jgi:hypothetical protein
VPLGRLVRSTDCLWLNLTDPQMRINIITFLKGKKDERSVA